MITIAQIKEELALLRQLDKGYRVFGAGDHRYQLAPPLADEYVQALEQEQGIVLPPGYRQFLIQAGNGGAGPYYGIHALEFSLERWRDWCRDLRYLRRPFPLTGDVEFWDELNAETRWANHVYRLEHDLAYEAAWDAIIEKYAQPTYRAGTLAVCDYGCGGVFHLVVNGAEPDTVWFYDYETGFYSLQIRFLDWYAMWLDDALDRAARQDFAPRNARYAFLKYSRNERYVPLPLPAAMEAWWAQRTL